jgi:hypothetical protein
MTPKTLMKRRFTMQTLTNLECVSLPPSKLLSVLVRMWRLWQMPFKRCRHTGEGSAPGRVVSLGQRTSKPMNNVLTCHAQSIAPQPIFRSGKLHMKPSTPSLVTYPNILGESSSLPARADTPSLNPL